MPTIFQRRDDQRIWPKKRKYYQPFMTTTPVLLLFFVTAVLCVALLQNIVNSGTPLGTRSDNGTEGDSRKQAIEVGEPSPESTDSPISTFPTSIEDWNTTFPASTNDATSMLPTSTNDATSMLPTSIEDWNSTLPTPVDTPTPAPPDSPDGSITPTPPLPVATYTSVSGEDGEGITAPTPTPTPVCGVQVDSSYVTSSESILTSHTYEDPAYCLGICADRANCESIIFVSPVNLCYMLTYTFDPPSLGGRSMSSQSDPENGYFLYDAACYMLGFTALPLSLTSNFNTSEPTMTTTSTTESPIFTNFANSTIPESANSTSQLDSEPTIESTTNSTAASPIFTNFANSTITESTNSTSQPDPEPTIESTTNSTAAEPPTSQSTPAEVTTPSNPSSFTHSSIIQIITNSTTTQPTTTQPTTTLTTTTQPTTTQPTTTQPTTTQPTTTQPTSTQPTSTLTTTTQPTTTQPTTTQPTTTQPTTTQPTSTLTTTTLTTTSLTTTSLTTTLTTLPLTESSSPIILPAPSTGPPSSITSSIASESPGSSLESSTPTPPSTSTQISMPTSTSSQTTSSDVQSSDPATFSDGTTSTVSATIAAAESTSQATTSASPSSASSSLQSTVIVSSSETATSATSSQQSSNAPFATLQATSGFQTPTAAQSAGASQSDSDSASLPAINPISVSALASNSISTSASNSASASSYTLASSSVSTSSSVSASSYTSASSSASNLQSISNSQAAPNLASASNSASVQLASNTGSQSPASNSANPTASASNSNSDSASNTNPITGTNSGATQAQPSSTGSVSAIAIAQSDSPKLVVTAINPGPGSSGSGTSGSGSGSNGQGTQPLLENNPYVLSLPVPVTGSAYFGATFASVTMSVLFKSFWCVVFASAKMMEPFYQLAKEGASATGKAPILRPYLRGGIDWPDLNPANRYWVMFLTTVVSISLSLQASLASEAMTVQAGATCDTENGTELCDPVWVINSAVVRGLQTTLILVALAIAALMWLNWNRPSGIASYPCSIASMASLLSNSDEELTENLRRIDPDAKDGVVEEALKGKLLSFKRTEERSGLDVVGISIQNEGVESSNRGVGSDLADAATGAHISSSLLSRIPWGKGYIVIITILHMALFGVILSFVLAGNDIYKVNLLGADGSQHLTAVKWKFLDGTKFGPRFFMTMVVSFLFISFWEMVELSVRVMVPYRRLQKRNTKSRHIFTMYLHGVPFTSMFKALWHRNWYHAFIAFITVLSYVLLVLIAGVPYNYGQIKNVSFYSSVTSLVILFIMIVGMVSLLFWQMGNPKMPRKPDTLVNTWLLMCSSRFIADFKGRPLAEVEDEIDHGHRRYWFGKAMGVDEVERWMVEAEGDQASRRLLHIDKPLQDRYF